MANTRHARARGLILMTAFPMISFLGCTDIPRNSTEKNDLSKMPTASIEIAGRIRYTVFIARADADGGLVVQRGLMNTTEAELPADHGMIFVFDEDAHRSFWMRNTIIPLDIAYIRSDGVIVKTHTMEPLNEMGYPSIEPAKYALEVRAGQFAKWGVVAGDRVILPESITGD